MSNDLTRCRRALGYTGKGSDPYKRCGKPAAWLATDYTWPDSPGSPHDYGLCDKHLAEMRELPGDGPRDVRPAP